MHIVSGSIITNTIFMNELTKEFLISFFELKLIVRIWLIVSLFGRIYAHTCARLYSSLLHYITPHISSDACLGGLNSRARESSNNRRYRAASVLVCSCARVLVYQCILAHVVSLLCYIMYACVYGRMPGWITWTCVREYSYVGRGTRARVYTLCIFIPSVSDYVVDNVFLADTQRS